MSIIYKFYHLLLNHYHLRHQIFLSYSRRDLSTAEAIQDRLVKAGFTTWIDQTGLEPGTFNWDLAIQEAIEQSFALVWVASPNGKKSPYIKDEIDTAIARGIRVIPAWIEGENWIEAAFLGSGQMQHIDCRINNFDAGIDKLIIALGEEFLNNAPFYTIITDKLDISSSSKLFSVEIIRNDKTLVVNANKYDTSAQFLNDVWKEIDGAYPPYSYGAHWWLVGENRSRKRLYIPKRFKHVLIPIKWCEAYTKYCAQAFGGESIESHYGNYFDKALPQYVHELYWKVVDLDWLETNDHIIYGVVNDSLLNKYTPRQQINHLRLYQPKDQGIVVCAQAGYSDNMGRVFDPPPPPFGVYLT